MVWSLSGTMEPGGGSGDYRGQGSGGGGQKAEDWVGDQAQEGMCMASQVLSR